MTDPRHETQSPTIKVLEQAPLEDLLLAVKEIPEIINRRAQPLFRGRERRLALAEVAQRLRGEPRFVNWLVSGSKDKTPLERFNSDGDIILTQSEVSDAINYSDPDAIRF